MRRYIDIVSPISTNRPSLLKKLENERLDEAKAFQNMMIATNQIVDEFARDYNRNGLNLLHTLHRFEKIASNLRQDRAVWFLREIRWAVMKELWVTVQQTHPQETENWGAFTQKVFKLYQRYELEFKRQVGWTPGFVGNSAKSHIETIWHSLEHFKGVPYTKLQTYVFDMSKTWSGRATDQFKGIKHDLSEIENEFIEKARGKVTMKPGDEIILKLPDNYVWVKLDRASCDDEANAMGHCGNSPRSGSSDRIISLRHVEEEIEGILYMRPCLTFILYSNGYLGEMKGRGNQKPAAHYHDQIEALLRSEHIKGIIGDGYAPEQNFSVNDMEHDRAEALLAHNPRLLPPKDLYKRYGLSGPVLELFETVYWGQGYKKFIAAMHNLEVSSEDMPHLLAKYQPPSELYMHEKVSAKFIKVVKAGINSMQGSPYRYDWDKKAYTHAFWGHSSEGTAGLFPGKMTEEERTKLFKYVPEATLPKQFYETFGVNDDFAYSMLKSVAEEGPEFLFRHGMDTAEWPEEDQSKLWTTDLGALSKKLGRDPNDSNPYNHDYSPDMLASFRWWYKHHGDENQDDLFDHEVTLEDKIDFAMETWGGSNQYIEPERKDEHGGRWKFGWWADLDAFLTDVAGEDNNSDIRELLGDQDSIEVDYPGDEDHNVQNFDDTIDLQTYIALRKYAAQLLAENDDDVELDSWESIFDVFQQYDDDMVSAVKESVQTGEEIGAANERTEAKQRFFKYLKPKWGTLRYSDTYTDDDGTVYPIEETEVFFDMDDAQLCEYFDKGFRNGNTLAPDEFFEPKHYESPRYGWQGYDEEAAASHFADTCPIDFDKEPNPFWPAMFPQNVEKLKTMSADQMRKVMKKLLAKIQADLPNFTWTIPTNDDHVEDSLLRLHTKYYG